MTTYDPESYKAGYRVGFEAGKMSASFAQGGLAAAIQKFTENQPKQTRRSTPKCDCGHARSTHNDLGYCQGKDRTVDRSYADQCGCEGFENDQTRAAREARNR